MRATPWNVLLSSEEIGAYYALMDTIDPAQAEKTRAFYEARTIPQLKALARQAWFCNEASSYQLAQSYIALRIAP